jgi:hypothetical protein
MFSRVLARQQLRSRTAAALLTMNVRWNSSSNGTLQQPPDTYRPSTPILSSVAAPTTHEPFSLSNETDPLEDAISQLTQIVDDANARLSDIAKNATSASTESPPSDVESVIRMKGRQISLLLTTLANDVGSKGKEAQTQLRATAQYLDIRHKSELASYIIAMDSNEEISRKCNHAMIHLNAAVLVVLRQSEVAQEQIASAILAAQRTRELCQQQLDVILKMEKELQNPLPVHFQDINLKHHIDHVIEVLEASTNEIRKSAEDAQKTLARVSNFPKAIVAELIDFADAAQMKFVAAATEVRRKISDAQGALVNAATEVKKLSNSIVGNTSIPYHPTDEDFQAELILQRITLQQAAEAAEEADASLATAFENKIKIVQDAELKRQAAAALALVAKVKAIEAAEAKRQKSIMQSDESSIKKSPDSGPTLETASNTATAGTPPDGLKVRQAKAREEKRQASAAAAAEHKQALDAACTAKMDVVKSASKALSAVRQAVEAAHMKHIDASRQISDITAKLSKPKVHDIALKYLIRVENDMKIKAEIAAETEWLLSSAAIALQTRHEVDEAVQVEREHNASYEAEASHRIAEMAQDKKRGINKNI